jgi:hypothetical protein
MTAIQQQIIDLLSSEISLALSSAQYHRNEPGADPDKNDAYIASYISRASTLRQVREHLENEFCVIHYDPR